MKEQHTPGKAFYTCFGDYPEAPQEGEPVRFYSNKQELLIACREGQIKELFVESFTRLGKNTAGALGLLRELTGAGVKVHLLKEGRVV